MKAKQCLEKQQIGERKHSVVQSGGSFGKESLSVESGKTSEVQFVDDGDFVEEV